MQDWYSGTLPYSITARDALSERGEVAYCEGVHRIRLRHKGNYLTTSPDGGELTLTETTGAAAQFDLFDWGGNSYLGRSVLTGGFLNGAKEGTVTADSRARTSST
ncbi:hypothetical protein GCM10029992_39900 [Glycomyces albus]